MREGLVAILTRQRRRMVAVRAAEAFAVGGVASALAAAAIMAGRIVVGRYPLAAGALCSLPLLGGMALAASRRARAGVHAQAPVAWAIAVTMIICGGAAAAATVTSTLILLPKNWCVLVVPFGALPPVVLALAFAARLQTVARDVDGRAGLSERLTTAWELASSEGDSAFAAAVEAQAIEHTSRRLGGVRYWTRTRATIGALGLAVLTVALMLPWESLETPQAARDRRWRAASARAADALLGPLATLADSIVADRPALAEDVRRLEGLARLLADGRPELAADWQGRVVDLDNLAASLREAMQSEDLTPAARERIMALLSAIEQASADIVASMGPEAPDRHAARAPSETARPAEAVGPTGWVSVYDPRYAATTAPSVDTSSQPALPFDQAWANARRRAAESLRADGIPAKYRPLIRDFFAVED